MEQPPCSPSDNQEQKEYFSGKKKQHTEPEPEKLGRLLRFIVSPPNLLVGNEACPIFCGKFDTFKNQFITLPSGKDIIDVEVGKKEPTSDISLFREQLESFSSHMKCAIKNLGKLGQCIKNPFWHGMASLCCTKSHPRTHRGY